MHLIVCLDSRDGWRFNGRRQSRDVEVCKKCLQLSENGTLRMNAYSGKLFSSTPEKIRVSETFLADAMQGDYCFSEGEFPSLNNVEHIYVFRWNCVYPSDTVFSPQMSGFQKISAEDFCGNSHPVITMEVYKR